MSAVTARIHVGWMKLREFSGALCGRKWSVKMKERVYKACMQAAMVYGGETWVMRKRRKVYCSELSTMMRMMCGVKLRERVVWS